MAGETVLIVDDNIENIIFMDEYILEPNGYKVLKAKNGVEALNIALAQPVDLIITDLMMPEMTGLELLESLQDAGANIPAILTTFHGSEETAVKAFRLGARDYMIKPFTIEDMLAAVDRALTEARLRKERNQLTKNLLNANKKLEMQMKGLRILHAVGQSVTSSLNLEDVLNRIVEAAIYLSGAEEGSIMLLDKQGDLYLRAARGLGETTVRGFKIKVKDSIAGQVVRTGEPIIIGGEDEDESFKVKTKYFVKSLINIPLKLGDRVVGVLAVNQKTTVKPFTQRHLELLSTLANYTSIAIENARLYAKAAHQINQAESRQKQLQQEVNAQTATLDTTRAKMVQSEVMVALGHLATGVAHELNTPIATVLKQIELINKKTKNQADIAPHTNQITQEANQCKKTIKSLLDYAGQKPPKKSPFNLNKIIEQAWKRVDNIVTSSGKIETIRGYNPNLPLILADQTQLQQAFFYILKSAIEAMPMGGTLRIITRSVGNEVQVIIADTGQGIPAKEIRYIFDPFHKSSRHSYGLGLSIAYGVIERHNGTIEVDSKAGSGTTFTIRIPAHNQPKSENKK